MSSSAERPSIDKESYCASQLVAKARIHCREERPSWDSQPGAESHQQLGLGCENWVSYIHTHMFQIFLWLLHVQVKYQSEWTGFGQ